MLSKLSKKLIVKIPPIQKKNEIGFDIQEIMKMKL
jgi:hypothetical protein